MSAIRSVKLLRDPTRRPADPQESYSSDPTSSDATRKLNSILFEAMRDPSAVTSLYGYREMEKAVVDTPTARSSISISDLCATFGAIRRTLHPDSSNSEVCRPCTTFALFGCEARVRHI